MYTKFITTVMIILKNMNFVICAGVGDDAMRPQSRTDTIISVGDVQVQPDSRVTEAGGNSHNLDYLNLEQNFSQMSVHSTPTTDARPKTHLLKRYSRWGKLSKKFTLLLNIKTSIGSFKC